jgi:hypothetical protein
MDWGCDQGLEGATADGCGHALWGLAGMFCCKESLISDLVVRQCNRGSLMADVRPRASRRQKGQSSQVPGGSDLRTHADTISLEAKGHGITWLCPYCAKPTAPDGAVLVLFRFLSLAASVPGD